MQQLTSNGSTVDRFKSLFVLGISCNFTTVAGLIFVWVILSKYVGLEGLFSSFFAVAVFTPVFMGDALNCYTLGRIKLDAEKKYNELVITAEGKERAAKSYRLYRAVSAMSAYLLAGTIIASSFDDPEKYGWLRIVFLMAFAVHFLRANYFINRFISPVCRAFQGKVARNRIIIILGIFFVWYYYLFTTAVEPMSGLQIASVGFVYFVINAMLHPLPSRLSLFSNRSKNFKPLVAKVTEIDDTELLASRTGKAIKAIADEILNSGNYTLLSNIRMPMPELPIFESIGSLLLSKEKNSLLFVFSTELKPKVNKKLITISDGKYYITSDFKSPGNMYPEQIIYGYCDSNTLDDIAQKHFSEPFEAVDELEKGALGKLEKMLELTINHLKTHKSTDKSSQCNLSEQENN